MAFGAYKKVYNLTNERLETFWDSEGIVIDPKGEITLPEEIARHVLKKFGPDSSNKDKPVKVSLSKPDVKHEYKVFEEEDVPSDYEETKDIFLGRKKPRKKKAVGK